MKLHLKAQVKIEAAIADWSSDTLGIYLDNNKVGGQPENSYLDSYLAIV